MSELPRAFTILLKVLPEEFREHHRRGMQELLGGYTQGRGSWSRGLMWARASLDVVWVGLSLPFWIMMPRRSSSPRQIATMVNGGL